MEAHKERKEQLNSGGKKLDEDSCNGGGTIDDGGEAARRPGVIDRTVKELIRDAIFSDDKGKCNMTQNPNDVLAFSRSVNKIDSSLE